MQVLNENGKTYLSGPMTQAEVRNRNGRLYPTKICKEATLELKGRVDESGGVLSYLEHPNHSDLIYEFSGGKIVKLDWINETGVANCKVEILDDTKDGKSILEGLKNGETYGISTRGIGSLDEDGVVQPGLIFTTADIIKTHGKQSCQICNLTEGVKENTMSDFLLDEKEEDCGCYLNLDEVEQKIVKENLKRKILEIFK